MCFYIISVACGYTYFSSELLTAVLCSLSSVSITSYYSVLFLVSSSFNNNYEIWNIHSFLSITCDYSVLFLVSSYNNHYEIWNIHKAMKYISGELIFSQGNLIVSPHMNSKWDTFGQDLVKISKISLWK